MSAVSLTKAKDFLNIDGTQFDAEVQRMVDRAEAVIARRVGPLAPTTVTDEVHTGPGPVLLREWPILSVTSATSDGVTVTDLVLDPITGRLWGLFGATAFGVKVTYVVGRTSLPADLEEAVLELTRHLWQSQQGSAPVPSVLQPQEPDLTPAGGGFLLPYRVQSLIEPHLLPPVIA